MYIIMMLIYFVSQELAELQSTYSIMFVISNKNHLTFGNTGVPLLLELSSSYSFGWIFFAQDLFSHSATLNSDQSKQIVDSCDYL